jgi:hypothetical protein
MTTRRSKRAGGPRTLAGKSASSKNSFKHGLTALGFSDGVEAQEAKSFIDELVNYYKPQSPLESLQIQRIALCKAKLVKLYSVEQAAQDLALLSLQGNPEVVLNRIEGFSLVSRRIALSMIRGEKHVLPLGLSERRLKEIKQEIEGVKSLLADELALRSVLKQTVRFLDTLWTELDEGEFSADRYLSWAIKKIEDFSHEKSSKSSRQEPFEETLAKVHLPDEVRSLPKVSVRKELGPESFHDSICNDLTCFTQLWADFSDAKKLVVRFHEAQALMIKAITPSPEESDRLMRYQTSIERRLSSAIGELLALQARR